MFIVVTAATGGRRICILELVCLLLPSLTGRAPFQTHSGHTALVTSFRRSNSFPLCNLMFASAAEASQQSLNSGDEEETKALSSQGFILWRNIQRRLQHLQLPAEVRRALSTLNWAQVVRSSRTGAVDMRPVFQHVKDFIKGERIRQSGRPCLGKMGGQSGSDDSELLESLPLRLLGQRRILETSFVPIFFFARERLLENDAEGDVSALGITLMDPAFKKFLKLFRDLPMVQSMPVACSKLDEGYARFLNLITDVRGSSTKLVLADSWSLELESFTKYSKAVFSAATLLLSVPAQFHRNRKQFFFFAEAVLPRMLKVLLLLHRLQEYLLDEAHSQFAENTFENAARHRGARLLYASTSELALLLDSLAHGCLVACSPDFAADFPQALYAYDKGVPPLTAFARVLNNKKSAQQPADKTPHMHIRKVSCKNSLVFAARESQLRRPPLRNDGSGLMRENRTQQQRADESGADVSLTNSGRSRLTEMHPVEGVHLLAAQYMEIMREHWKELKQPSLRYNIECARAHVELSLRVTTTLQGVVVAGISDVLLHEGEKASPGTSPTSKSRSRRQSRPVLDHIPSAFLHGLPPIFEEKEPSVPALDVDRLPLAELPPAITESSSALQQLARAGSAADGFAGN